MGLQLWNGTAVAPVVVGLPTDATTRHNTAHYQSSEDTPSKTSQFNQRYWTDQTAKPEGMASRFWNWMTGSHTKEPPRRSLKKEAEKWSEGLCSDLVPGCHFDTIYTFKVESETGADSQFSLAINIITKKESDEPIRECILSKLKHNCNPAPTKCDNYISFPRPIGVPSSLWIGKFRDHCSTDNPGFDIYIPDSCTGRTLYRYPEPIPCFTLTPSISLKAKGINTNTMYNTPTTCESYIDTAHRECINNINWNMKNTILPKITSCFNHTIPNYPQIQNCSTFLFPPPANTSLSTPLPTLSVLPPIQKEQSFSMRSSLKIISPVLPSPLNSAWKIHIWLTGHDTSEEVYQSQQRIISFLQRSIGYMQKGTTRHCHFDNHMINLDTFKDTCGIEGKDNQLELSFPFSCRHQQPFGTREKLNCFALSDDLYLENEVIEGALKGVWSSLADMDCKQTIEEATRDIIIPLIQEQYSTSEEFPKMIQCPVQPISDHQRTTAWIGLPVVLSVGALWISVVLIKNCRSKKEEGPCITIIPKPDVPDVVSGDYQQIVEMDQVV